MSLFSSVDKYRGLISQISNHVFWLVKTENLNSDWSKFEFWILIDQNRNIVYIIKKSNSTLPVKVNEFNEATAPKIFGGDI